MDKYIESPNIPTGKVSLCIVDRRARKEIIYSLNKLGAEVIMAGSCSGLYDAVSCHPDMYLHHLGGKDIMAALNAPEDTVCELEKKGFSIIRGSRAVLGKYPDTVAYNVARIGEYAICNIKYTDKVLLEKLKDRGVKLIDIKQGYSKCSICIVNSAAVITSDEGVSDVLSQKGFDVLKINSGAISLPGLNYGFIGGASGLLNVSVLSFAGDVERHPDYKSIKNFLEKYDMKIESLDDDELTDVGTIIPLMECFADS